MQPDDAARAAEGLQAAGDPPYCCAHAEAKRAHWATERKHATRGKEIGEQVDRAEVVAAFADAGATLRSKLQTLAWVLPPQLVGRHEATIRAAVADQVQRMLSDLADRFERAAG